MAWSGGGGFKFYRLGDVVAGADTAPEEVRETLRKRGVTMGPRTEDKPMPRHRVEDVTFAEVDAARAKLADSHFCDTCNKLLLKSKADARSYIGVLLFSPRHRAGRVKDEFALKPYRCPHQPGWHVGRDFNTAYLVNERKAR